MKYCLHFLVSHVINQVNVNVFWCCRHGDNVKIPFTITNADLDTTTEVSTTTTEVSTTTTRVSTTTTGVSTTTTVTTTAPSHPATESSAVGSTASSSTRQTVPSHSTSLTTSQVSTGPDGGHGRTSQDNRDSSSQTTNIGMVKWI